jgi:RNA polymerase sigma-B factor
VTLSTQAPDRQRLDQERELFKRLADEPDPVDRDRLVERFLPLARHFALRYARPGEPFDDVFQVACIGLLNAIDRFDVSRERAFSSFAVPTIAGEIKRHYRDRTWAVHVPRDLQDLVLATERMARGLETGLGRTPTVPELAVKLERTEEQVLEALRASPAQRAVSLDAPQGDDEDSSATLGATIATDDPGFEQAEDRTVLRRLTRALTPRDRLIVALRFEYDLTQQQIGEHVGLSQMQISRILRSSLARLRPYAEARDEQAAA